MGRLYGVPFLFVDKGGNSMNRKQLVKANCANYRADGMCVLRDIPCPLITAFNYKGHEFPTDEAQCNYYDTHVAPPLYRTDEWTATQPAKRYSYRDCNICGTRYQARSSRSKYCSEGCKRIARKRANNRYYVSNK